MKKSGRNILKTLKHYDKKNLKLDLSSGLSVAALSIPQNMAYALVAGINPIFGLYTSIISKIISTFTSRSNYIIVGPTNLMAMAIASNLTNVQEGSYIEYVILLTFLVGIFQIIAGILKLGRLVRYVSHPVIVGLTTGAALLIGVSQLENLTGINVGRSYNIFFELFYLFKKITSINFITLLFGIITIIVIIGIKKSQFKIPAYLFGVIIVTLISMVSGLSDTMSTVGRINISSFSIHLPNLNPGLILNLSTKALAVAIVGLIQTLAVVKSISTRANEDLNINKEFVSQGLMNFGLSFFNGFASSASFTNTFTNYQSGAKTRISELISALSILIFILFFNFFIKFIPISSLAGLILIVAYNMVNIEGIKELIRATKADTLIFILTFLATIISPRIEYAVYLGVLFSVISVMKDISKASVGHLKYDENSHAKIVQTVPEEVEDDEYIILDLIGDFSFSAADSFKYELEHVSDAGCGYIIRIRNIDNIDITSINELKKFINEVQHQDREVLISGVNQNKYEILKNLGIIDMVGEDNIFFESDMVLSSTVDAVEQAENNNNNHKNDKNKNKEKIDEKEEKKEEDN
ncbi:MAG TPA: SulP family inorganic anion transporter [Halanaerobiales bacterium]|nr:SulP family inorganic anion transporter [Halanaerobiales bacterium]